MKTDQEHEGIDFTIKFYRLLQDQRKGWYRDVHIYVIDVTLTVTTIRTLQLTLESRYQVRKDCLFLALAGQQHLTGFLGGTVKKR